MEDSRFYIRTLLLKTLPDGGYSASVRNGIMTEFGILLEEEKEYAAKEVLKLVDKCETEQELLTCAKARIAQIAGE